jgi:predicted small secreted protein
MEMESMKKLIGLSLALAMATSLAGCDTPQGQNAAGGAVLGGATGALLGAALTGRPGGALVGGVTGATTGAIVAAAATPRDAGYAPPPRRCAEFYYDYYGNRVCRTYY